MIPAPDPGGPWRPVEVFDRVDSTNAEAARRPDPWRVVVADVQEQGRGRLGRGWVTTPGQALAVSVVIPPPPGSPGWVPLVAGLALSRAVAQVAGVPAALKWPNDVLAPTDGDRKLAGLLCERVGSAPDEVVVVGCGVNVAQDRAGLPVDTATSLALAGAPGTDRGRLLTAYLRHLAALLGDLATDPAAVHDAYRAACATVGATVRVHEPGHTVEGVASAVDEEGRLCLRTAEGGYAVAAGDVVHVRRAG
ncbi:MAG TPA: biotin--[acetyl-CoA-carboxylase] ligase [Dermatophilaceae bacterium]|nr:biotin--[acetyl-CoA-carboxylase] ligase [Dermatophilaceae bacterium]